MHSTRSGLAPALRGGTTFRGLAPALRGVATFLLLALACQTLASKVRADCSAEIDAQAVGLCGSLPRASLHLIGEQLKPAVKAKTSDCGGGGPALTVVFRPVTAAAIGDAVPARAGAKPYAGYEHWVPVANTATASCPELVLALYEAVESGARRAAATSDSSAPAISAPAGANPLYFALNGRPVDRVPTALEAIKAYRAALQRQGGVAEAIAGSATGASPIDSAVEDTLQMLGQIVVDRASAQAYRLLKQKLTALLGCRDDYRSSRDFHATCRVLLPLRIEDLAMSRDALLAALVDDALAILERRRDALSKAHPELAGLVAAVGAAPVPAPAATADPTERALLPVLRASILPLVTRPHAVADDSIARSVLAAVLSYAGNLRPEQLTPARSVVVIATYALLQCSTPSDPEADAQKRVARCEIGANIDALSAATPDLRAAAHALGQQLLVLALPTARGEDPHVRLTHAVDTVFATSCMLLAAAPEPSFGCKDPAGLSRPEDAVALMQPIVTGALAADGNATITAIVHALQLDASVLAQRSNRRAFALLGGLVNYASTYLPSGKAPNDSSAAALAGAHEQRTKILESLTAAMTDRSGRQGDSVIAVGGALRIVGGARLGLPRKGTAFYGPLSLPLGVAVTHIPEEDAWCSCGVHLQIDAVDLGHYLAYDDGANVKKPKLADALAPSVTLGLAFGASIPFVLGITAGYSPQFAYDDANPKRKGTLNLGATAGFHVPLLDAN